MSPVVIFGIGVLVFLITVYGAVMAGGLLLTDRHLVQNPDLDPFEDERPSDRPLIPAEY